jgi:hypothetical protein
VRACSRGARAQVREGLYYNPYFPGGAIAMPRMLADGGVEYDDGTPSNSSQQAKVRAHGGVCVCVGGGALAPARPSVQLRWRPTAAQHWHETLAHEWVRCLAGCQRAPHAVAPALAAPCPVFRM